MCVSVCSATLLTIQALRERTKRLDRAQRVIVMQLNLVHSMPSEQGTWPERIAPVLTSSGRAPAHRVPPV